MRKIGTFFSLLVVVIFATVFSGAALSLNMVWTCAFGFILFFTALGILGLIHNVQSRVSFIEIDTVSRREIHKGFKQFEDLVNVKALASDEALQKIDTYANATEEERRLQFLAPLWEEKSYTIDG